MLILGIRDMMILRIFPSYLLAAQTLSAPAGSPPSARHSASSRDRLAELLSAARRPGDFYTSISSCLAAAAHRAGCVLNLALLTLEQFGAARYSGN